MIYTVINTYNKAILCYNIKYRKHTKYNKILKFNKYIKFNDKRNEFNVIDNLKINNKFKVVNKT